MPSSMTLSSSSSSTASSPSMINHHAHQAHHQQRHHPHHLQSVPNATLLQQTGLSSQTSNTLLHHAAAVAAGVSGSSLSSSNSNTVQPSAPAAPPCHTASNTSLHHHPHSHGNAQHHHTTHHSSPSSTLTSLQHNHLSHGHLLNEIYDRSNKRPRIMNFPYGHNLQLPQISTAINSSASSGVVPMISDIASHYRGAYGSPINHLNQMYPHLSHAQKFVDGLSHSLTGTTTSFTPSSRLSGPVNNEVLIETIDNGEDAYNPHFEAISPPPNDESRASPLQSLKDHITASINDCEVKMNTVEQHIIFLKAKAEQLEAATRKPPTHSEEEVQKNGGMREPTLVQKIYQENFTKASQSHQQFSKLCYENLEDPLPLYNHPMDLQITHQIHKKYLIIRDSLIDRIKKNKQEKEQSDKMLSEKYDSLMIEWIKKVEKIESNPTKRQRDAKMREYFEKQFPELKKIREEHQRNSNQNRNNRSDNNDVDDNIDSLQVPELKDKMRSYAVIPPIMFSEEERKQQIRYENRNGFLKDPVALHNELKMINIWTEGEREIFKEKYLLTPKKFEVIAQFLERKSVADCVKYYYLSKKKENYKQLFRKQIKKRTRAMIRAQQQQNMPQNQQQPSNRNLLSTSARTVDSLTVGKQYLKSATSVILPYSIPLTSSSTTITFTISSNNSGPSPESTSTHITNGPVTTSIISSTSNANSSTTTSNITANSAITKCDTNTGDSSHQDETNANTNGLATNDATSDDFCCLLCSDKISSNNLQKSHVVNSSNIHLYGLNTTQLNTKSTANLNGGLVYGRVCLRCHHKKNAGKRHHKRHCPIPSCDRRRKVVKCLKQLPQQWLDMPNDRKQCFAIKLNIPLDAKVGCARCVMRIGRAIGLGNNRNSDKNFNQRNISSPNIESKEEIRKIWSNQDDIDKLRSLIKTNGKNWSNISNAFDSSKTAEDCRKAFMYFKNEFQLIAPLKEYYQSVGRQTDNIEAISDDTDPDDNVSSIGADDLSDTTADSNSLDEATMPNHESEDTASASSSIGNGIKLEPQEQTVSESATLLKSNLQEFKPLSSSQASLKSDYDSSATMSADESSNANDNQATIGSFSSTRKIESKTEDFSSIRAVGSSSTNNYPFGNRDRPLGFDAPQVPTFLINPNAPSVQIPVTQSAPSHHSTGSSSSHIFSVDHSRPPVSANSSNEQSSSGGTCVRDLIYKAIEKSLQSETKREVNNPVNLDQIKPDPSPPVNTSTTQHALCLKREPMPSNSHQAPPPPPDFSKMEILASTALQHQQQRSSEMLLGENLIKTEGLAAINMSQSGLLPHHNESDLCEVQDLSNKSKDRTKSYDQVSNRNSPSNYPNKMAKLDSHRASPSHPVIKPFIHAPERPFSAYSIQPAHSNNPASRIPNMIESLMHLDPKASGSRVPSQTNPYGLPSSKINSKSPSQMPQSTFPITPKNEATIRDKLIQPLVAGSGSITQGTPVVLPGSGQQPPMPTQQSLPTSNMPTFNSKLHPPAPSIFHSNHPSPQVLDMFRHMSSEYSKGSITQGTPLMMAGNPQAPHGTLPMIPSSAASAALLTSDHLSAHSANSSSRTSGIKAEDFMYQSNSKTSSRNRYPDPKSTSINNVSLSPYEMMKNSLDSNIQQSLYRPFSPNFSSSKQATPSAKDSHISQICIDFNTSKQMQPRRSSASSEKEQISHQDSSRLLVPLPPPSAPPPGVTTDSNSSKRHRPYPVSPAPSPSPIYLPDRGPTSADKLIEAQWNSVGLGNFNYMNRQNVIQQCFPPASKATSVIQSAVQQQAVRDYRDELAQFKHSPLVGGHFPHDNEAFATLVNAAVQQPSLSVPSSTASIQSRITKEGFEKCFTESLANNPSSGNKQTISNRVVYPPIGSDLPNEIITDLSNKAKDDKRNRDTPSRSGSTSSGPENLKNKNVVPRMPIPSSFASSSRTMPPQPDKKMNMFDARKPQKYPLPKNYPILSQSPSQPVFRPDLMAAAYSHANPGLKFSSQFSLEHFERELRESQNKEEANRKKAATNETTMDEASKLFSQSFQKDGAVSGGITAGSLIDAIITKQINIGATNKQNPDPFSTPLNRVKQPGVSKSPSPPSMQSPPPTSAPHESKWAGPGFKMMKDKAPNPPSISPSHLKSLGNKLEGIAAAAADVPSVYPPAVDNHRLRVALESERFGNKHLAPPNLLFRSEVIHMASSAPPTMPTNVATVSSPSLSVPSKQLSHMEPISPPQTSAPSRHPWSLFQLPMPLYAASGVKLPQQQPSSAPEAHLSHLTVSYDSFSINRIAEAMQRQSCSSNEPSRQEVAAAAKIKQSSVESLSSSSHIEASNSNISIKNDDGGNNNTGNSGSSDSITVSSDVRNSGENTQLSSYPDSPNSPGEMVIDENRQPTPVPSPDLHKQNQSDSDSNKNSKSGVIKLPNESSTSESCKSNSAILNEPQPQYEPLSDDEN